MRLIGADKLKFHCNFEGDCSPADIEGCKECASYVLDYRDIQEQPAVNIIETDNEKTGT